MNLEFKALGHADWCELRSQFQHFQQELNCVDDTNQNLALAFEHYERGDALEGQPGGLDEALSNFKIAAQLAPEFFLAWVRCGGIELRKKHYEEAERCYMNAQRLNTHDARPKLGIAYVYFITGRLVEGERLFNEVIAENPDHDEPHVGLGWMFNDHGQEEKARKHFSLALEKNPRNDGAHEGMGFAYLHKKKTKEAKTHFQLSIQYNPNNGGSHVGLGLVEHHLKNYEAAEKNFLIALKISPYDESAWNGLGYIAEATGDAKKAEECFLKARQYTPAQPFSYLALARLYGRQDRNDEALRMYEECLELVYAGSTRDSIISEMNYIKRRLK